MKTKKLGYEDYFNRTYGKRPAKVTQERELWDTALKGREAQRILDACKEWDKARTASVFGWEACKLAKE